MIFRTGSVLIVGMCEENVLNDIYAFLTKLLKVEFEHICQSLIGSSHYIMKDKKKKVRRKVIMIMMMPEPGQNQDPNQDPNPNQDQCTTTKSNLSSYPTIEFDIVDEFETIQIVEKKVKRNYKKKNVLKI